MSDGKWGALARATGDALAGAGPLPYEAELLVLGVPVRLRSNAPEVVRAFEDALGSEGRGAWPELVAGERVEGRLLLHGGDEGGHLHAPVTHRVDDARRVVLTTPGSICVSDARRREFTGRVTRALLEDEGHFKSAVLESAVLAVVTRLDRHPLHASAVMKGGSALLLAAPSGTGKSTLAYAAARGGLSVLADEIVFVQSHPLRVWGMPRLLHLPLGARRHFRELADVPTRLLANGKEKMSLSVAALDAAPVLPVSERMGICLLERTNARETSWEEIPPAEAAGAMVEQVDPGFDLFRDTLGGVVEAVAAGGAWRLRLGGSPAEAVPVLHLLLDEVERRARAAS